MSLTSWFSFGRSSSGQTSNVQDCQASHGLTSQGDQPLEETHIVTSFDDIATRFNELNDEVSRLQAACTRQQEDIKNYINQIQANRIQAQKQAKIHDGQMSKLREELKQESQAKSNLQAAIANPHNLRSLREQGPSKPFVQLLKNERQENKVKLQQARDQYATSKSQCVVLQKQIAIVKQELHDAVNQKEDLKLDVEFLKCTTSPPCPSIDSKSNLSIQDDDEILIDVPFVLVLVDGDAYKFTDMLSSQCADSSTHPATRAAVNLKRNLQTYILKHKLPPHSKLMVRVLMNRTGHANSKLPGFKRRTGQAMAVIDDFMLRFTEFAPLFEFIDAGVGKERVDSKIHELYHTFIPNLACRKIFLAIARDNGFARMLEQHIHHPEARAKTCLISAGDIALEIEQLNLETVEWPSVFARQFRPKEVTIKLARQELRVERAAAKAREEKEALIEQLGAQGYEDLLRRQGFQALTEELIGAKPVDVLVKDLAAMDRRRLGVRTDTSFERQVILNVRNHDVEENPGEDVYVEDGVD